MSRPTKVVLNGVYGKLTATEDLGVRGRDRWWAWVCECGRTGERSAGNLAASTGCGKCTRGKRTHGLRRSPEYGVWWQMLNRCYNPKVKGYHRYGGRGIVVCDRWRESFAAFHADVGPRPSPVHQIDRRDNDGPYSPDNCRWVLRAVQSRNRSTNRLVTFRGDTKPLVDWAAEVGVKAQTIARRLARGWTVERSLTTPPLSPGAH